MAKKVVFLSYDNLSNIHYHQQYYVSTIYISKNTLFFFRPRRIIFIPGTQKMRNLFINSKTLHVYMDTCCSNHCSPVRQQHIC